MRSELSPGAWWKFPRCRLLDMHCNLSKNIWVLNICFFAVSSTAQFFWELSVSGWKLAAINFAPYECLSSLYLTSRAFVFRIQASKVFLYLQIYQETGGKCDLPPWVHQWRGSHRYSILAHGQERSRGWPRHCGLFLHTLVCLYWLQMELKVISMCNIICKHVCLFVCINFHVFILWARNKLQ